MAPPVAQGSLIEWYATLVGSMPGGDLDLGGTATTREVGDAVLAHL